MPGAVECVVLILIASIFAIAIVRGYRELTKPEPIRKERVHREERESQRASG